MPKKKTFFRFAIKHLLFASRLRFVGSVLLIYNLKIKTWPSKKSTAQWLHCVYSCRLYLKQCHCKHNILKYEDPTKLHLCSTICFWDTSMYSNQSKHVFCRIKFSISCTGLCGTQKLDTCYLKKQFYLKTWHWPNTKTIFYVLKRQWIHLHLLGNGFCSQKTASC